MIALEYSNLIGSLIVLVNDDGSVLVGLMYFDNCVEHNVLAQITYIIDQFVFVCKLGELIYG